MPDKRVCLITEVRIIGTVCGSALTDSRRCVHSSDQPDNAASVNTRCLLLTSHETCKYILWGQMNRFFNLMFFWPCIMNWLYIICHLWLTDYYLFIKYYSPLHVSSLKCSSSGGYSCTHAAYGTVTKNSHREWQYHMLHVYNWILLKMSTWGSKHVEENIILWIKNSWCIKLVINIQIFKMAEWTKKCSDVS